MIKLSVPQLAQEEKAAIIEVIDSGQLAQGLYVDQFEKEFSDYIGAKYAAAVNSGTAALQLACLALGLKEGDEVITTPFSFIASTNAILYAGATPVFVDIDENYNLNPELVEKAISPRTKAILVVHLYGFPAQMEPIMRLAKQYDLKVIEDAAQAHGSRIDSKTIGTFGDIACFSFYPTKNMTTGEGGMIVSNDNALIEKSKLLRSHGATKRYYHSELSYNFRMTNLNAAIGREQLKKLDYFNKKRNENADYLSAQLKNVGTIKLPNQKKGVFSCFHQYTVSIERPLSRDIFAHMLLEAGIESGVYYPVPIYRQEVHKKRFAAINHNFQANDLFPRTEAAVKDVLSLPIHPQLTKSELDFVANTVMSLVSNSLPTLRQY